MTGSLFHGSRAEHVLAAIGPPYLLLPASDADIKRRYLYRTFLNDFAWQGDMPACYNLPSPQLRPHIPFPTVALATRMRDLIVVALFIPPYYLIIVFSAP